MGRAGDEPGCRSSSEARASAATADSAILDGPVQWFGLAEYVVRRDVPWAWVVDLSD